MPLLTVGSETREPVELYYEDHCSGQSCVVKGAPHGFNLSHAAEFNKGLPDFLAS